MTVRSQSSRPPRAAFTAAGGTPNAGRVGAPAPEGATPPARPEPLAWGAVVGPSDLPDRARTWELFMPPGLDLLNANHRIHWSTRARITKDLRWTAFVLAKKARVPRLGRARVWCVYEPPPTRAVKDVANLAPSAKALVDGALVDTGVLPDDSDQYLVGPDMRRGAVHHQGRLVLIVAELESLT